MKSLGENFWHFVANLVILENGGEHELKMGGEKTNSEQPGLGNGGQEGKGITAGGPTPVGEKKKGVEFS